MYTLFLFYKNMFYKDIEAEMCKIYEICMDKPEAEIWKENNFLGWHNYMFLTKP